MKIKRIKIATLLFAMLSAGVILMSCEEKNNNGGNNYSYKVIKYTGCHEHFTDEVNSDAEKLEYSVQGHDLTITRYNETYNCCDSVLRINVSIEDNKILITESGEFMCDCICKRDAQYQVTDIPSGHYTVKIAGREETFDIDIQ